jgi:hypothetical protein
MELVDVDVLAAQDAVDAWTPTDGLSPRSLTILRASAAVLTWRASIASRAQTNGRLAAEVAQARGQCRG